MNIIFLTIKFDYSINIQFKFEIFQKIQQEENIKKYISKTQNCPKFEQIVLNNVVRPHKKHGQKKIKKKKNFAEC